MVYFTFLVAALATYRISFMIGQEDGPFDLFSRLRGKVGQREWYGRGMHCTLCISFWVSLLAAFVASDSWLMVIPYWMGIAGAVLVLHRRS